MKVELKDISSCKKQLEFEIETDVVEKEREVIEKGISKKAKIPGFRPGKVPRNVIQSRFAEEIEAELREKIVSKFFKQAVDERSIVPLHNPKLEDYSQKEGEPLTFKVGFEVEPEVAVKDYKGVRIKDKKVEVEEKEIEDVINALRESFGRYEASDAKMAQDGDFVTVELLGKYLDGKGEEIKNDNLSIIVGAKDNLPAFNQQLFTMKKEEVKEFDVEYPADYFSKDLAGRKVHYKMTLKEIKVKHLPELDDEFAANAYATYYADKAKAGMKGEEKVAAEKKQGEKEEKEIKTMLDLKKVIKEQLLQKKSLEKEFALKNEILNKLIEANEFEIPEAMLEHQINYRVERIVREMIASGVNPAKADVNWKEIKEKQKEPAAKEVKGMLILSAIGKQEKIEASEEEVNERIKREARANGTTFQDMKDRLSTEGLLELKNQIVREKSLDFLLSNANIN